MDGLLETLWKQRYTKFQQLKSHIILDSDVAKFSTSLFSILENISFPLTDYWSHRSLTAAAHYMIQPWCDQWLHIIWFNPDVIND